MTQNVRQIGFIACFLLVLLRVSIGWQFLYEGLWKLGTQKTSKPWSAEGYLANARGPLRDKFRSLVEDPDGLARLDYDHVVKDWDNWRARFVAHYPSLPDLDAKLKLMLDGPEQFTQPLKQLPDGVDLGKFVQKRYVKADGYVRYHDEKKQLETNLHLLPEERSLLLGLAKGKSEAVKAWQAAVKGLYAKTHSLSLKERLQVLLKEDPERVGAVRREEDRTPEDERAGKVVYERQGEKQVYEELLRRYQAGLESTRETFQQEHLDSLWHKVLAKKAELVGPVDALTAEYHADAYKLLEPAEEGEAEQRSAEARRQGPVPPEHTQLWQVNQVTMWSLTILGALLMAGMFSRLSALGAAALLMLFYLPMPPWPGVPEAPGPEHSLFVNKNLIEVIACLALAFLPTGRWIGIDALIRRFILRKKTD